MEIKTIEDFRKFLEDFKTEHIHWENNTLESFLEALSRYSEDIQSFYDNTNQKIDVAIPSWKVFADLLKGASMYE